jgi:glucose-1-phosphate adenylyltransferase
MRSNDEMAAKTLAFVLAGGTGRRLNPLTRYRPKPLVPFGGCFRILDFTLSNCLNSELARTYVLTQHESDSIAAYLRKGWGRLAPSDPEFAIPNPAIPGKRYAGTADAVLQNLSLLPENGCSFVLVASSDHVYKMDYRDLLSFHATTGAEVTIATVDHPKEFSYEMGVLKVDEHHRVVALEEKPQNCLSDSTNEKTVPVSMGVYVFNYETLFEIAQTDRTALVDIAVDLIPRLLRSHKVHAYPSEDNAHRKPFYWRDVGTLQAYYDASMDLLAADAPINLFDKNWPIRSAGRSPLGGDGALSEVGGEIRTNFVIPHAANVTGATVYRSVLSPGVVLESGVDVRHSVLLPGAVIGRGATIQRAIIDAHVVIEAGERIGYSVTRDQSRFHVLPNGIVVVSPDHLLPSFKVDATTECC